MILAFFYQWISEDVAARKKAIHSNQSTGPPPRLVQLVETKAPSKDETHYDEL